MKPEIISFIFFLIFIIGFLFIDLGILNRKSHEISFKQAFLWTLIWVSLSLGLYLLILTKGELLHGITTNDKLMEITQKYHNHLKFENNNFDSNIDIYRKNLALEYITGYLIEYSLSTDNVFVILLIFISFGLKEKFYRRVLFWGIIGAIVMRFIFIFITSALIMSFSWILYLFGAFLLYTGIRMFISKEKDEKIDTHHHPIVKLTARFLRVIPRMVGQRFYIYKNRKLMFTPLLVVLLVVEFSDVVFAVDSVPAVFSVTNDPFIVFFSNVFAILGLRSLFFLVAKAMNRFRYLKKGISSLLVFVGLKMLIPHEYLTAINYKTSYFLIIIILILGITIIASLLKPRRLN
jgi:tellurite resistance protein TerC